MIRLDLSVLGSVMIGCPSLNIEIVCLTSNHLLLVEQGIIHYNVEL
jgi:hypothetical protein